MRLQAVFCHLISRHDYKVRRSAAQAEWRSLAA
jgi:hypothetical protein